MSDFLNQSYFDYQLSPNKENLQVEALIVDHYSGRRCQKDWDEPTNKDLKASVPTTVQAHSYPRIKGSALGFHGDVNTDWLSDQIQ